MSRLKHLLRIALPPLSPSNITSAPETFWAPVGLGKDVLLRELEALYWEGVRGELENIVRTLNTWQKPDFSRVKVDDEDDDFIRGFDTFIDQVTQESRAFAIRHGEAPILLMSSKNCLHLEDRALKGPGSKTQRKRKETELRQKNSKNAAPTPNYAEALEQLLRDRKTDYASSRLKASVRHAVDALPRLRGLQQRAWMLLQATGFLDMEKLIEHRPPLGKHSFWKRPAIPQLTLSKFDEFCIPRLEPLRCSRPECGSIIRGSMFVSTAASPAPDQQTVVPGV